VLLRLVRVLAMVLVPAAMVRCDVLKVRGEASIRDGLKGRSGRVLRAERLVLVVMMAMVECDVLRVEMCL
jgi:hypothetical protein